MLLKGSGEKSGRGRVCVEVEVGMQGMGESVSKIDGDRWVGLTKEFPSSVGGGRKVVNNKGVDNFRV